MGLKAIPIEIGENALPLEIDETPLLQMFPIGKAPQAPESSEGESSKSQESPSSNESPRPSTTTENRPQATSIRNLLASSKPLYHQNAPGRSRTPVVIPPVRPTPPPSIRVQAIVKGRMPDLKRDEDYRHRRIDPARIRDVIDRNRKNQKNQRKG